MAEKITSHMKRIFAKTKGKSLYQEVQEGQGPLPHDLSKSPTQNVLELQRTE